MENNVERGGTHTIVGVRWKSTLVESRVRVFLMTRADEVFASDTGVIYGVHYLTQAGCSVLFSYTANSICSDSKRAGLTFVLITRKGTRARRITS